MRLTDWAGADSGHGGLTKDVDGDEVDGYDEGAFVPLSLKNKKNKKKQTYPYPRSAA